MAKKKKVSEYSYAYSYKRPTKWRDRYGNAIHKNCHGIRVTDEAWASLVEKAEAAQTSVSEIIEHFARGMEV